MVAHAVFENSVRFGREVAYFSPVAGIQSRWSADRERPPLKITPCEADIKQLRQELQLTNAGVPLYIVSFSIVFFKLMVSST